jgi:glycosyltransferase involved in cell wall biosynthesis
MKSYFDVSIILPCLNESEAVKCCIGNLKYSFPTAEIILVDNGSTDLSDWLAAMRGVKVVHEDKRGYGFAYQRGFVEATKKYIVMMDCDNSYSLEDIPKFYFSLWDADFVIGNRFGGDKISMPWANRYIGNPILSGMFRILFGTKIKDIHCGMRAITKEAYNKLDLKTGGMEFASEMVASAIKHKLKIAEIPINYYPRIGKSKLHPIRDAWRHIVFMLKYKIGG